MSIDSTLVTTPKLPQLVDSREIGLTIDVAPRPERVSSHVGVEPSGDVQLGIATYSPRLDRHGNGRRGIEVSVELANRLGLHVFDCLNVGSDFLGGGSASDS